MTEILPKHICDNLNLFARRVWGTPRCVLKQDAGIQYINLAGHTDAFRFLFSKDIDNDKMLVRKGYFTALQALNTSRYRRGAYITGQPGIGKTLFLIYLLVKHLGQEQPVAVQFTFFNNTFYVLFKDSTASFHVLHDVEPLFHCGPMWALCSSSDEFSSPSKVFYGHMSHIKTIQVTPFRSKHWRNWSEKAGAVCYIMDIWSEREIANLAKLLKQDVDHMTALAKKWGCIPETVLQTIHGNRDSTIEAEHYAYAPKAVRRCQEILSAIQMNDLPNDALSQFYFVRPRQDPELGRIHTDACADVPTLTVRHILAKALKTQRHSVRLQFFNAMDREGTRLTGNHIYENWFHSYFFAAIEHIECHWIQGLSGTAQLRGVPSLVCYDESALEAREPPYYWVAPKGFPGLSSALVLKDEIFAFRTTINRKLKLPTKGLRRLRDSLPADLKDVQWRMILVGMGESAIKGVARRWTGKICFPGENMHVPIGWCQVDPVTWGFTYKVFHDGSIPDAEVPIEESKDEDLESDEEFLEYNVDGLDSEDDSEDDWKVRRRITRNRPMSHA